MPEELDLSTVRLMPVEDMGDAEKALLKEHEAELTDDEKAAFVEFLTPKEEKKEEGEGEGEGKEGEGEGGESEEVPVFKTKEEADAWLDTKMKEHDDAVAKQKEEEAEAAKTGEEELRFFDPKWEPKNWNDYAVNFFKALVNNPKLAEAIAPMIRDQLAKMSAKERGEMDNVNAGFDKEMQELFKEGKIPDPSTPEGIKVDKQMSIIGARMGSANMREAYDQWSKTPKEFGGGYDPAAKKVVTQKQKAGMVSHGGGSGTPQKKEKSYSDVHRKSLDEQIDEAEKS